MADPVLTLSIYFLSIMAISLVYNFITIHPVASIMIYEKVSKAKSLSISAEFALLTATVYSCGFGLAMLFGADVSLASGDLTNIVIYATVLGSGFFVEFFRIWYIGKRFETNLVYSVIISEAGTATVLIVLAVLRNTLLGLI